MFTGSWPYSFDGHFNVYVFGCRGGALKHTLAGRGALSRLVAEVKV